MNERLLFFRVSYLCLSLIISTSQTFSSDGTSGWVVSMAKTAGTIALKAIGAGILGTSVIDHRNATRLSDKWHGRTGTPNTTGSARDEQTSRGLEAPAEKTPSVTRETRSNSSAVKVRPDHEYDYCASESPTAYTDSGVAEIDRDIANKRQHLKSLKENEKNYRHLARHAAMMEEIYQIEQYVRAAEAHREQVRPATLSDTAKMISDRQAYPDAALEQMQVQHKSNKQVVADIQREINKRRGEKMQNVGRTTLVQATAMILTTQTTGTASTEKAQTVSSAEEIRLAASIKAREAQSKRWKDSLWPSDWVSVHTAREYEKGTQAEREKLRSIQEQRFSGSLTSLQKHEGERYKEVSDQMIENRKNTNGGGSNGGGDKEPEKDPRGPLKTAVGTAAIREAGKDKPFKREPQKIDPEKHKPNHETGNPLEWHDKEAKQKHVWRDEGGHVPKETDTAKDMFNDVVQKPENYLGTNKAGNHVYAGPNKIDGKQAYVKVREGKVENAGVNDTPWTKEQILGTETPPRDRGGSNQYVIIGGGGLAAIANSSDAEAAEIKVQLNAPAITTKVQEMKFADDPGAEYALPDAPKTHKAHFTTQPSGETILDSFDRSKIDTSAFTKSPIGATSNKGDFNFSAETIERLKSTPFQKSPKATDVIVKPLDNPYALPPAPANHKPISPSVLNLPTVSKPVSSKPIDLKPMPTPKLTLPTTSKPAVTSTPPPTPRSTPSYKPASTPTYRPSAPASRPSVPSFKPSSTGSGFGKRN